MNLFDEIKSYVGFNDDDARRLRQLHPTVEPYFNAIVRQFYDRLMQHPRARGVFTGPEQIKRLRTSLQGWLQGVFTGPYDQKYFQKRKRIGQAHVDVGLLPQFMFGAMNLIRTQFLEILCDEVCEEIVETLDDDPQHLPASAVASVEKILDIELTIMVQSYWDELMQQKLEIPAALATGLAHEVRNPLNSIALQMTLLERKLRAKNVDVDTFEPVFDAMNTELRRIKQMNSEILDFAKPVDIERIPVDLRELFDEIRQSHQLTLDAGDVDMEVSVRGDVELQCDPNRLNQVFVNLLTNAMEAMPEGGTIGVEIEGKDEGVVVEFSDDGIGMAPAKTHQIFDLFYTTKTAGTGIGLAIARKIVEAHDGSIDVMSHRGNGTTFTVYLPRPV